MQGTATQANEARACRESHRILKKRIGISRDAGREHRAAYIDKSPAQISAHLLDSGQNLCSERTLYRILREYVVAVVLYMYSRYIA